MTKQTIELDVRPADGYKHIQESIEWVDENTAVIILRFEKIQPREILLREGGNILLNGKLWHEVNGNEFPLTNNDFNLKIGDKFYTLPRTKEKSWRGVNFELIEIREDCVICKALNYCCDLADVVLMRDEWEFKKIS